MRLALPSSTPCSAIAFAAASPPFNASPPTRLSPASSGVTSKVRILPFSSAATKVGPVRVISSSPSEPCTTQIGFGAEVLQHLRQRLHPLPREYADHLPLDAGRIGQRPQQVEDGSGGEFDAGRADILHRRMMRRREHEADAGLGDAAADMIGRDVDLDAQRGQYVGGSRARRQRAVAVLGHWHAAACHDERGAGRDIDRAGAVAAGADHVDGIRRAP